jgi:dipeptidyl aminopeptidase/acylaminoacyl peptidase
VWLNRTQNERIFAVYDLSQSENEPLREYTETVEQGWIENDNNPIVVGSSSKLLQIMSREMGQNGGYQHIAEIDMESGSRRFLTSGNWEVTSIVGYKGDTSDVVYVSTESNVWERNVYSSKDGIPKSCLSCSFSDWGNDRGVPSEISTKCTVFTVDCSHSLAYCVLSCQGPAVPFSLLVRYDNGQLVEVLTLESNEMLIEAAHDRFLPKEKKIIVVPADDEQGQPELYGSVLYPPGFDPSKRNHYPVLVSVYGGPGSETILMTNVFYNKWALYQSAERDCIIVSVDGRGTGYRGDKFKFSVYRHLGEFETEDQIRAGRYLSNLNYVNGSRLAIYGTSYGGYMAGMVGSSGSGVFKVAISRSPVTDWRYYDSIYTERYMGTPEDNFDEYERSSLVNRASMLGDVSFLLIHGTGDDNVHFQNTAQLVKALTESEVQFRLQFYTDKAHSISGLSAREHLYTLIDSFLRENL